MAFLKTVLHLGVCLYAWMITVADGDFVPRADNVKWESTNFRTILTWTPPPTNYTYTVLFSELGADWKMIAECIRISNIECDLTHSLLPLDRTYSADIQTESDADLDYELEEPPHTISPDFNPYRESNITAATFTLETIGDGKVTLHIKDPPTPIPHEHHEKTLTIRDVLHNDLKYKIVYNKAGTTGKRENISDSSTAVLSNLDAGQSYCFKVAAFIPSRAKVRQLGAWSKQACTGTMGNPVPVLSVGALVGVLFILLIIISIIIIVTILCCRRC